jgi:2-polyprenyl-6-hydroxyphenyl methylase/3-demethylubiquinone-9 3-methyltransferase
LSESYYERAMRHPISSGWHRNCVGLVKSLMPRGSCEKHLDVGCGDGVRIRLVKPEGEIVGVDVDEGMLEEARKRGIRTFCESAEALHFPDESFDVVTAIEVFEHVQHPVLAFAEIHRVLKSHGFFVCVTPSNSLLFKLVWNLWTNAGMGRFWKEKHVHDYALWGHTKTGLSLVDYLRDAGFRPEKTASANYGMVVGVRSLKV